LIATGGLLVILLFVPRLLPVACNTVATHGQGISLDALARAPPNQFTNSPPLLAPLFGVMPADNSGQNIQGPNSKTPLVSGHEKS